MGDHNVAHPGPNGHLAVPVTVGAQPGSAAGGCRSLTVQVSFDDGTTWAAARVTGTGNRRVAQVGHPAGHEYVTVKKTAASPGFFPARTSGVTAGAVPRPPSFVLRTIFLRRSPSPEVR
ncbi:MAG: hypothetical protein QOJ50_2319 [Cryptosporangiaceae bacterium]|nr:hypothetical protein [Cryptosporangiaceae bacterium]